MPSIEYLTEQHYTPLWKRHRDRVLRLIRKDEELSRHFFDENGKLRTGSNNLESKLSNVFTETYNENVAQEFYVMLQPYLVA